MPIEQIAIANDETRSMEEKENTLKRREVYWQNKLKTIIPNGMNKREG